MEVTFPTALPGVGAPRHLHGARQRRAGGEQADARAAGAACVGTTRGVTLSPKAALEKAPQMGDGEKRGRRDM